MSTTNSTSNAYNAGSLSTYNAFQPQIQRSYAQMVADPLGSSYFQNQLAQMQKGVQQSGQRNISNIAQNARAGGGVLSNSGGFVSSQLQRGALANSLQGSNAFNTALNSALSNRSTALAGMAAYQPLQTGQSTTTSGTGTWLPQVLGAGLNMAMPGIGSMLGGNSFSAGYQQPQMARPASGPALQPSWATSGINQGNTGFPY